VLEIVPPLCVNVIVGVVVEMVMVPSRIQVFPFALRQRVVLAGNVLALVPVVAIPTVKSVEALAAWKVTSTA